jgi:hypothetical protein
MNYDGPPLSMLLCPVGPEFHSKKFPLSYYQNIAASGMGKLVEISSKTFATWFSNVKRVSVNVVYSGTNSSFNASFIGKMYDLNDTLAYLGKQPPPYNTIDRLSLGIDGYLSEYEEPYESIGRFPRWYFFEEVGNSGYDISVDGSLAIGFYIIEDKFYAFLPTAGFPVQLSISEQRISFLFTEANGSAIRSVTYTPIELFFP